MHKKRKKCEAFGIKYKAYTNVKDDLILCKWFYCNKNYQEEFEENLK